MPVVAGAVQIMLITRAEHQVVAAAGRIGRRFRRDEHRRPDLALQPLRQVRPRTIDGRDQACIGPRCREVAAVSC